MKKVVDGNQNQRYQLRVTRSHKKMNATAAQLETLRNLSATAERMGLIEPAKAGFTSYSKAMTGSASQEEVNAMSHNIREQIAWAKGTAFADSIA